MTTIADIRNELVEVFNDLRAGRIEAKDAVEINNTAGKIISACKVQIAYHALRGEAPDIAFLSSGNAAPLARAQLQNAQLRGAAPKASPLGASEAKPREEQ